MMFRWGSITEGMLRQLLSSTRLRIINLQLVNSLTDELFKVDNTMLLCIYVFMFDRQDILDRNPLPSLEFLTLEQCHGSWLFFVQISNEPVQFQFLSFLNSNEFQKPNLIDFSRLSVSLLEQLLSQSGPLASLHVWGCAKY